MCLFLHNRHIEFCAPGNVLSPGVFALCRKNAQPRRGGKMKQKTKQKKERFENLKNTLYAFRIITQCAPLMLVSQVATMIAYWFFTGFVQEIMFLKVLLDIVENGGSFRQFAVMVAVFATAGILSKFVDCFGDYVCSRQMKIFYKNLNRKIFKKAVEVDMQCYENPEFYDKYQRATEIISDSHYSEFSYCFAMVISGGMTGIFLIAYVISIDAKILLILLSMIFVLIIESVKGKVEVEKDKKMTPHKRSKAYVKRTVFLREFAKDMRTSGIFNVMHSRYKDAVANNREIIRKYGRKMALLEVLSGLFGTSLPVVITYLYAAYRFAVKRNLSISNFSVIMTAMSNLKDVFNDLGEAIGAIRKEAKYFGNLREFFDYESTVTGGSKEAQELETLEFRNVSFTYPSAKKPSLVNVNLKINKGETAAIVGKNGAGKTTFVKLLLRFYDPDEGVILYNGTDIREYSIKSLRDRLATVFQDYKVFALSVGENVLCREVETSEDKNIVETALHNSGADACVNALPNKSDTVLTREFDEKGTGLSGGEQQKVAAARMFARAFDLAILDEPSSALDPIAEYKMYESLIAATEEKTVIYISHRLSSAVLSDKIYVFDGGTVAESGTHEELMENMGIYAEMFTLQASSYKSGEGSVSD